MLELFLPMLIAIMAGGSVVAQQVLNANLRSALDSVAWSGVASYFVGLMCMAVLALAMRSPIPDAAIMARVPWWAWSGGLFGAIFIGLAIVLVPKLGAAAFLALLVTGQMLTSAAFDHFGVFGLAQRSMDLSRALGIVLLIGGVILIRR